jgi:hypothetical protein
MTELRLTEKQWGEHRHLSSKLRELENVLAMIKKRYGYDVRLYRSYVDASGNTDRDIICLDLDLSDLEALLNISINKAKTKIKEIEGSGV